LLEAPPAWRGFLFRGSPDMTDGNCFDRDKCGTALNDQRFQMLEDIARELSGDVVSML
jgi:hypothetical protein